MSQFRTGLFIISLDFELYWGVRDKRTAASYRENLHGTHKAVLEILRLFKKYKIHATWSTVGFLFFRSRESLLKNLPAALPGYRDLNLCPYRYFFESEDLEPDFHFATDLLQAIAEIPGQEIGTHTFSHFYCLEEGVTRESFSADLCQAQKIGSQAGHFPESLVFPRNQWRRDFLPLLSEQGIQCYRGVEDHPAYAATAGRHQGYIRRAIRLIDSYLPITGHHTFGPNRCTGEVPYNIPASRFLRPYTPKLRWFDPLKKKRILASLRHAATHKQAFHLWWHPHNFGRHLEQNAGFLERILQEYRLLSDRFGMRALSMSETAKELAFWTKPLRGRRLRPLDVEL